MWDNALQVVHCSYGLMDNHFLVRSWQFMPPHHPFIYDGHLDWDYPLPIFYTEKYVLHWFQSSVKQFFSTKIFGVWTNYLLTHSPAEPQ